MRPIELKVRRAVEQCALGCATTQEWALKWLGGSRDASAAAVAANMALAAAKSAYHFDAAREASSRAWCAARAANALAAAIQCATSVDWRAGRASALYAKEAAMLADRALAGR